RTNPKTPRPASMRAWPRGRGDSGRGTPGCLSFLWEGLVQPRRRPPRRPGQPSRFSAGRDDGRGPQGGAMDGSDRTTTEANPFTATILAQLSQELNLAPGHVERVVALLDEGTPSPSSPATGRSR